MDGPNGAGGTSSWDAQNQAAAGNPGGGEGYRAVREWGEYDKLRERGVPYGFRGPVTDARVLDRMERFCPDWDQDIRWPPPGFLEHEALMTQRADFFERKQQEEGGYLGPVPYASNQSRNSSILQSHQQWCRRNAREAQDRQAALIRESRALEEGDREQRAARWRQQTNSCCPQNSQTDFNNNSQGI